MERRRNYDEFQFRSWTLPHNIRTDPNNINPRDGILVHSILNTSNYKQDDGFIEQNVPVFATSASYDIMNSSSSETKSSSCSSTISSTVKIQLDNIAMDEELTTKTKNLLHSMLIATASSILDNEIVTNSFDITDDTPTLIPSSSDLGRFCEDIESQVVNFISKDMLELNYLSTRTELGFNGSNEIEIDEECDINDHFRPSSSSESSVDFPIKESMHKYHLEMSHSSEELVDKSKYICKTQYSPLLEEKSDDNEHTTDKITNSITVPVATMSEHKGDKRKWDKTFLCIFCAKSFTKLPRHWYMKHKNEKEVSKIMNLSSNSKAKKKLIAELQNRGVALNNTNIIKTGAGSVVPKRRPRPGVKMNVEDYICCRYCNQLFLKTYIEKHERKRCSFNV